MPSGANTNMREPVVKEKMAILKSERNLGKTAFASMESKPHLGSYESPSIAGKQHHLSRSRNPSESDSHSTIPKERSRIRTNPWLPSPRATPNNSASDGMSSDSSSALSVVLLDGTRNDICLEDTDKDEGIADVTSSENLAYSTDSRGEPLGTDTVERRTRKQTLNLENLNRLSARWSTISDGSIDLNSPSTQFYLKQFGNIDPPVNCEYEETLEYMLETGVIGRDENYLSTQDLLDDQSSSLETSIEDKDIDAEKNAFPVESKRKACMKLFDGIDESVGDSMVDSTDTGYSSLGRDGQIESEFLNCMTDERSFSESEFMNAVSTMERYNDLTDDEHFFRPSGRSLSEIRTSLEEKVYQLRQEKIIVQQKIKEAKEEEKVRDRERRKFQRQATKHKKDHLLKTLHGLRERLENQSQRLQASYSSVLSMQQRLTQRESPFLLLST
ncbi:hypothetical protein ScPMuIL_007417 [Solemya velum]